MIFILKKYNNNKIIILYSSFFIKQSINQNSYKIQLMIYLQTQNSAKAKLVNFKEIFTILNLFY